MDARVEMPVTQENVQVVAKPRRRTYTAEYKPDAGSGEGMVGAAVQIDAQAVASSRW